MPRTTTLYAVRRESPEHGTCWRAKRNLVVEANQKLEDACQDYSHGKPSEEDVLQFALEISAKLYHETGRCLGVRVDEGNVFFYY